MPTDGAATQTPDLTTDYSVTSVQVDRLRSRGWTSLPGLLSRDLVEEIRQHLAAGAAHDNYAGPKAGMKSTNQKRQNLAWQDPFLRGALESRRMMSATLALMGQESAVFGQDVGFSKLPSGGETPWHQDFPYLPFDRKGGLALWIALVDLTPSMGILRYLEGSHREGLLGYVDPGQDILERFPELRELEVGSVESMSAGDALAHWDLTVHGAAGNNSDVTREAWGLQFARSDSIYTGLSHSHYDTFNLTPGTQLADHESFPRIGLDGRIGE